MSIKKRILSMVLVVFIAGMSLSGCAGQYALFNKAHPFIGNLGGKWVGAVVNWIIGVPIVYPICIFADTFIFNTIEFWTGDNIIVTAAGDSFEQTDGNGNRLAAVKNEDGTLSVRVTEITGETTEYLLEREGNDFSMFDADGVLLSSYTVADEDLVN
ncbi:MAG: DUF3332 domain-containing protein [Spirochaetaceae bacterium]|jgi:hypothetical protein|nr:DUF3332 domain-containing protein [Spirochaetaceae bacterium]